MLAKWKKPEGEEEDPDAREPYSVMTVEDAAEVLKEINEINLTKTPKGKEDARGASYVGFHTEMVRAKDVASPNEDWKAIPGTHQLHHVSTTTTPGELVIRKRLCFVCPACEDRDFLNCTRTEELGPVKTFRMVRLPSYVVEARAETRTRSGQDLHRHAMAGLATEGSVVAVDINNKMSMVLVTTPLGAGHFNDDMKGKVLTPMQQPNCFSSANAKIRKFDAALIRSPPLTAHEKEVREGQNKFFVFEINDYDFLSLRIEFLT